ncbi:carboxypeptidase regulatory-like domain-containing protein [Nocardioides dongxiaopingii]|uniref:carboxypeptidase-like regulatory domain-containing protein n=1 Tax=Nocardioides sp. S-1144 TaxID=2582905 RepID=UPI00110F2261|nr:carboxypeptidase-like regulatory domain-containing protein [Nocardioides sp. S-1144]QCW50983.1 carboxypeptidase regulatory-like domain-containing protein [Nocardioides sp. S-1144]
MLLDPTRLPRAPRPLLAALVAGLLLLGLAGPTPRADASAPARPSAAAAVTGRVVSFDGAAVAGATVRLRAVARTGLGPVVATATTNGRGQFSLPGGSSSTPYYVELVAGSHQRGWVGQDPKAFQTALTWADTYAGGAALGTVVAVPAFVRGVVVDSQTKLGVRGVKVTFTPLGEAPLSATTQRDGSFRITGITGGEDGAMKFAGAAVGYENGVWGCANAVVPPALECQPQIGVMPGRIRIDKLP